MDDQCRQELNTWRFDVARAVASFEYYSSADGDAVLEGFRTLEAARALPEANPLPMTHFVRFVDMPEDERPLMQHEQSFSAEAQHLLH